MARRLRFAFRFDALIEAIVPTAGVFLFVSVLARPDYRLVSLPRSTCSLSSRSCSMHRAWLDERDRRDGSRTARARSRPPCCAPTLKVGAVAVVAALVLGPALPGAGEAPLWDLDTGSGGGTRVTLSPLVDIRGRLVDQTNQVAFHGGEPDAFLLAAHSARHVRRQDLVVGVASTQACRVTSLERPHRSRPATPWSRRSPSRTCHRSGCPPRSRRST